MKTAIGYVRISKKDQSVYSLPDQQLKIKEYCEYNRVELIATFKDDGESSYTFDRPDYIALENFIKSHKGQVNYLLIVDHDRFSRNISEALAKITQLEKKFDVKVLALNEPLNLDTNDPSTFLNRAFKYLMANHELLNIRKRTTNGIRNAIRSGRVVNNAPFGYINIRDEQGKPTLKLEEAKAAIVRMMFYEFVHGVSHQLIIKKARKLGYNYRGNSTFLRMMSNSVYAGLLRLPAGDGQPERMIKAIHEPIITEEMYWAAHTIVNERGKKRVIPNETFPLRGVLKCTCGLNLTASFSKGKKHRYKYYTCYKERHKNYRCEKVHELVDNLLKQLSFNPTQLNKIKRICEAELLGKNDHTRQQIERCQKELAGLQNKIEKLEEKMLNEVINEQTYKRWYSKLVAEKSTHEAYMTQLKADGKDMLYDLDLAFPRLTNMHTLFAKTNLAGKQALLKKVFERGLIYDGMLLRTPYIHPAFAHNYDSINEKGLLLVEQPEQFQFDLRSCTA